MAYNFSQVTAECGCLVDIEADYSWPSCRCAGNDCYRDEAEWSYEISIVEPCAQHRPNHPDIVVEWREDGEIGRYIRAAQEEAWDEAHDRFCEPNCQKFRHDNPYRKES